MNKNSQSSVVIITGAAKRIGAQTAKTLHAAGFNVALHYHQSKDAAEQLCNNLNAERTNSALSIQADLLETAGLSQLINKTVQHWGQLNALINNASSFYPTLVGEISDEDWHDLIGSNLKAPLFLSQAAAPHLKTSQGCIINIVDIHSERPMRKHVVYSIAKAGLAAMTKSLARELAPEIRVNGVSPGAILWPENEMNAETQNTILDRIALKRQGEPEDIANTVKFLLTDAPYVTGQIIAVDGGRSLNM